MNKYEILTTSMRKIIVTANTSDEAWKIASSQFKDWEVIMITSFKINIYD